MKANPRWCVLPLAAFSALISGIFNAQAQFVPVPLTLESYNQDMIVELSAPPPLTPGVYSTASMDGGTNNNGDTWNEQGYFEANPTVGLPPAGTVMDSLADANHHYLFAPDYTQKNAIMLDANPVFTNVTVTVTTPGSYGALSFLTSGGNGGCIFRYTAHHADGSTEVGQSPSADWFNGANPAWIANGRVNAQSYTLDNLNSNNPRLYSKDVTLSNASPVTSIDLAYVSSAAGAHTCIMAISGAATAGGTFNPIAITGYNADIVVEATAQERAVLPDGITTATMDGGVANTGTTFYEKGYAFKTPTNGLPAAGSTLTNAAATNHVYMLAPSYVNSSNVVYIDAGVGTVTLTPASPAAYYGLSLLAASANGTTPLTYTVTHADNSTETGTVSIPDWFGNTPVAFTVNGRVNHDNSLLDSINAGDPRLYGRDFPLTNITSPVIKIELTFAGTTSRAAILAVAGSSGPLPPSIATQPNPIKLNPGEEGTFTVTVTGTEPISYQFQKGTNGVFANISDGGNISGSRTNALTISNASVADAYDYRLIASNAAGSATSSVVSLTLLSPLPVITFPSDPVVGFGGTWPDAESPIHAIDGLTSKYLNRGANNGGSPFVGPVGFVVTPSQGRTILGAVRFYTANDSPERDPVDYKIEGSNNGGSTYAVIASGPLALPTTRNNTGEALDPITHAIQQVIITNSTAYSSYRVSFTNVRTPTGGGSLFQIGEVEMLGSLDTSGTPFFSAQPTNVVGQVGGSVQLVATASGAPTPTLRWGKVNGSGTLVPLSDGGNVSGTGTDTLTINSLTTAAGGQYAAIASNSAGSVTSSIVTLTILSSLQDITSPADAVEAVGDDSGTINGGSANPALAIDDSTTKYINGGSGFSSSAGFPPFGGPAGLTITPAAGATVVSGLRVYTADDNPDRDPVSYTLEGSNDGATYTVISTGALTPSTTRNVGGQVLSPLTAQVQEVLFNNAASYTSYRLTFGNVRNPNTANSVQVAEIELLGTVGVSGPSLSITKAGGNINITWSGGGTLEYIGDLNLAGNAANWTSTGNTSGSYSEATTASARFFRVRQ